jgi:hypothetical protein
MFCLAISALLLLLHVVPLPEKRKRFSTAWMGNDTQQDEKLIFNRTYFLSSLRISQKPQSNPLSRAHHHVSLIHAS